MARPRNFEKTRRLFTLIREQPGERAGRLAALLGWHRSDVMRMLPALEEAGMLVYENQQGRLWPFDRGADSCIDLD